MTGLVFAVLSVVYATPAHGGGVPLDHVATIRTLAARLDRELVLPHPIAIAVRDCPTANAYYQPRSRTLLVCHQLWNERRALYLTSGTDHEATERLLRDSMTYTVFHELGHALHRELALPMLGRYEDVADDLAVLLMIRLGLAEIAGHAAGGHWLRSRQPGYAHDFRDEHGSGAQRAFSIGCLLYGSDPKAHASLLAAMHTPLDKLARCTRDYPDHLAAWRKLLHDHLRGS